MAKGFVLHLFIKFIQSLKVWFCICLSSSYNYQRLRSAPVYKAHTITTGLVLYLFMKFMQSPMFGSAPVNKDHTITNGIVLHLFIKLIQSPTFILHLFIKLIQSPTVCFWTCLSRSYNHQRFCSVPDYKAHKITKGLALHLIIKFIHSSNIWFYTCLKISYNH